MSFMKNNCTVNIDEIMDMLDWNNTPEVQERGRELARNVRCINVFLQPRHPGHRKNVWDNCALVLSERTDQELSPYLYELFLWLEDMNWPGAECIFSRLMQYKRDSLFEYELKLCKAEAKALKKRNWGYALAEF